MEPEPEECVFCSRRIDPVFLDDRPFMESRDELLTERSALDKTRGFLVSGISDCSLDSASCWWDIKGESDGEGEGEGEEAVLRFDDDLHFHRSAFMVRCVDLVR